LKSSLRKFYDHLHDLVTVTEYLCHKFPRICSIYRIYKPVLSSFMTYHLLCNKSNTTGVASGAWTAYLSEGPESTSDFSGIRVAQSLVFCVMFCRLSFILLLFFLLVNVLSVLLLLANVLSVLLLLANVLSVLLWFTVSDYSFDTFKLFLIKVFDL